MMEMLRRRFMQGLAAMLAGPVIKVLPSVPTAPTAIAGYASSFALAQPVGAGNILCMALMGTEVRGSDIVATADNGRLFTRMASVEDGAVFYMPDAGGVQSITVSSNVDRYEFVEFAEED